MAQQPRVCDEKSRVVKFLSDILRENSYSSPGGDGLLRAAPRNDNNVQRISSGQGWDSVR